LDQKNCPREGANKDESSFTNPPPSLRLDVLENFIRGLAASEDEPRHLALREAARLEPAWDRPAFELGRIYFARRDCELALPWFSRVPPNRPDGSEASFDAGVCHLVRNDAVRAEAAFSGLLERTRSENPRDRLPELPEVHNNLGIARLYMGKWSEAAMEFERAAALVEEEPDYWTNLGIAKLAEKQPAAAVLPLERVRKLDPQDKGARALLISTLESLGRGSDAAALRAEMPDSGSRSAQAVPKDPAALARLARVSRKFDRASLRLPDVSTGQPPRGKDIQKGRDGGRPN
jgi:tetratricopeptide (TPR) repeat protein